MERTPNKVCEFPRSPSLFNKLVEIMQDPELATEIGGLLEQLKFPVLVASRRITPEEHVRLLQIRSDAMSQLLTPAQQESVGREVRANSHEVSEFILHR